MSTNKSVAASKPGAKKRKAPDDIEEYNREVDAFNAEVDRHNAKVDKRNAQRRKHISAGKSKKHEPT